MASGRCQVRATLAYALPEMMEAGCTEGAGASDIVEVGLDEDDLRQWLCCGALLLRIVTSAFLHHHSVSGLLAPVSVKVLAARTNSFCMF